MLGGLRRRWKLLLAATLFSAGLAWAAGEHFKKVLWRSEGMLVHTPLPVPETQKGVYAPPTPQTLLALIKSPKNLQALRSELGIGAPANVLAGLIQVTQPRNAELIELRLDWPDPAKGAAVVNRLMELHAQDVAGLRKTSVRDQLAALEREGKACTERWTAAQQERDRFVASAGFRDARTEADRLDRDSSALEMSLAVARQEHVRCLAQVEKCDALLRSLKAAGAADVPADNLDPTYLTIRRELAEAIQVEKDRISETDQKLRARNREHAAALSLASRGAISRSEIDKVSDEIELLTLQKENSGKAIGKYTEELRSLPLQCATRRKADLTEQCEGLETRCAQIEDGLAGKRQQAKEREGLLRTADGLDRKVKLIDAEYLQLQGHLAALRQLRDTEAGELVVAAPAFPASEPVSSNRLKVVLAVFAGTLLLFMGLIAASDRLASGRTASACAGRLGLPVLARPFREEMSGTRTRGGKNGDDCESSHIALRLSRQLPDAGAVILLTSPNSKDEGEELVFVRHLSRHLAMTGERVVVLDARFAGDARYLSAPSRSGQAAQAGLAQYLTVGGQDILDFTQPTNIPGVDYISAGGPCPIATTSSSRPMQDALERLSDVYTRVLMVGPTLAHILETEVLAGHADSIIVALSSSSSCVSPEVERFVEYLQASNAPLLGAVICH